MVTKSTPNPVSPAQAQARLTQLLAMARRARIEADAVHEEWREARERLEAATLALAQAALPLGLGPATVEADDQGRAVVRRVVRQSIPSAAPGMPPDVRVGEQERRLPQLDGLARELHEARQAHAVARDAMNEGGAKAARLRHLADEAAAALERGGIRPGGRPALGVVTVAGNPPVGGATDG
jgi:hypothetical protein